MQCRSCGTEIADKAIVCFRCGHATADPVRRAVPVRPKRSPALSLVAAALLLLAGLYAGYFAQSAPDSERWLAIAGVLAGAAVIVIILGLLRRRR